MSDDYILLEQKMPVVLVVDDTSITLEIMAKILSKDGYRIETAMNGRQALDIIRKDFPDLVLLDVVMPEMDGYEVCRILKESPETKDIPVIFITVKNEMEDIVKGFEAGAVDYVTKPFNAVELLARVRTHMELKRKRDNEKELICRLNATLLERNREEEEARKERDRAEKYLDIAGFIFIVIQSDHTVSLINKAGCDILQYKSEEIIGKNWFDMFLPEREKEKVKEAFKKLFAGENEPVSNFENVVLSNNGKEKLIAWHNTVLRNEKGQIIATLSSGEDITERKRMEEALEYHTNLQRLSSQLSSSFVEIGDLDTKINHALKIIGEFFNADRAYVFQVRNDGKTVDNTHEWCAQNIEPQIDNLKGITSEVELPWFWKAMQAHETFHVASVRDLPPQAILEKAHFEAQGILSLVVVPILTDGKLLGFLGFDSTSSERTWSDDVIAMIRLTGETIGHSLDRKRVEEERERLILELREALTKIKTLSGMLPICSICKKIRDDKGYWNQIESYIKRHSEVDFSHSICPECAKIMYPAHYKQMYPEYDK